MEELASPVKEQKMGVSLTVLPELLDFYLLIYTAYSQ
jgi:hypothetical protein